MADMFVAFDHLTDRDLIEGLEAARDDLIDNKSDPLNIVAAALIHQSIKRLGKALA